MHELLLLVCESFLHIHIPDFDVKRCTHTHTSAPPAYVCIYVCSPSATTPARLGLGFLLDDLQEDAVNSSSPMWCCLLPEMPVCVSLCLCVSSPVTGRVQASKTAAS